MWANLKESLPPWINAHVLHGRARSSHRDACSGKCFQVELGVTYNIKGEGCGALGRCWMSWRSASLWPGCLWRATPAVRAPPPPREAIKQIVVDALGMGAPLGEGASGDVFAADMVRHCSAPVPSVTQATSAATDSVPPGGQRS